MKTLKYFFSYCETSYTNIKFWKISTTPLGINSITHSKPLD